jgi:hypothetical protein
MYFYTSFNLQLMQGIKFILLILFFSSIGNIIAQKDTIPLWSYELEGQAWKDWDSINKVWMKNTYFPCLKENKLKMNCANCVYIYFDAIFDIDSYGKLIDIQIIKENICSRKASEKLKNCFFNYFRNLVFPESLRKKKIKSKFGTGLKC